MRAFSFLDVEGDDEPAEQVDLVQLAQGEREMKDFWLSCGHHLLDRDEGGGLVVTDEFLKVYLARPELAPPPEACPVERTLHAALHGRSAPASSRRRTSRPWRMPMRARTGRCMLAFRDHLMRHQTLEAAYLDLVRHGLGSTPPLFLNQLVHRDPAQCARRHARIRSCCAPPKCSSGRSA